MRRLSYICTLAAEGAEPWEADGSRRSSRHRSTTRSVARRVTAAWLVAVALASASRVALADEPSPQDRTTARALAAEGYAALQTSDYTLAADRFKRANSLVHAPTLLVDLGRSYVGLGRLVEAHEAFQEVQREGVASDAPPSWQQALVAARTEDAALEPRLAWLTIRVKGADTPHVKLDNQELSQASVGARRAVDPGRRSVVAEAAGFFPTESAIDLGEGESGEINLVLERDPHYVPPTTPRPGERVLVVQKDTSRQRTLAYVAYGVGGAGLMLSGASTVAMLFARGDLEAECNGNHCPPSAADDRSRYRTYGTLAAVGFGVALAGAGVGTYLILSDKPESEKSKPYQVTAQLWLGSVRISGRF